MVAYSYGTPLVPPHPHNAPPLSSPFTGQGGLNPLSKELHYVPTEQPTLLAGPAGTNDGFSASYGTGAGALYGLVRNLLDLNGDGRADFVTLNANGTNPILAINRPSSAGNDYSTLDVPVNLPNAPAAPYNLGTPDLAFNLPIVATIDNVYQQIMDFNGDGRPDIVPATEGRNPSGDPDPNYWKILINTPGPSGRAAVFRSIASLHSFPVSGRLTNGVANGRRRNTSSRRNTVETRIDHSTAYSGRAGRDGHVPVLFRAR
jgi:hypothetical protein